jgi:hypothetical protein
VAKKKTSTVGSTRTASQVYRKTGTTIGDYLWVWGNPELSLTISNNDAHFGAASPISRAQMLGIRNVSMCGLGVPETTVYSQMLMQPVAHLDRIVWEISPDAGSKFQFTNKIAQIAELLKTYDSIEGVIIDDMSTVYRSEGLDPANLMDVRDALPTAPDGWRVRFYGVIYTMSLKDKGIEQFIRPLDVINLWTWSAEHNEQWSDNVRLVQKHGPGKPIVIGLYLTNYGGKKPMTTKMMAAQCKTALAMLKRKRIFGINFLLHGKEEPEIVAWTRDWVKHVSDQPLSM